MSKRGRERRTERPGECVSIVFTGFQCYRDEENESLPRLGRVYVLSIVLASRL